jgi:hypothetical protein
MRIILLLIIGTLLINCSSEINTPLEKNNYSKVTSYAEISKFVKGLANKYDLIKVDSIGKSVEGRNLYAIKLSLGEFGNDNSKIKILFFAQQHGNEQSGKEGSLLLVKELLKSENRYLFDKIDVAVVPQVNPDGSELNRRRNSNGIDLNRSHLILLEPELIALHQFFDNYLFEVSMDIHEYFPFDDSEELGFRRNFDEQIGVNTNINVSKGLRDLENKDYLPFIKKFLNDKGFSYFTYSPGDLTGKGYVRHSTFDINDGRQSFGIQNTFSFIQEGLNGKDNLVDNIKHRAEGQMTGMLGLIEYAYNHQTEIKELVKSERDKLINPISSEAIGIQLAHVQDGSKLDMPVLSSHSNSDSVIAINDYRPIVKSLYDVSKPIGYLVPKQLKDITTWAERHNLTTTSFIELNNIKIERYLINSIDSIDFEGENVANPSIELNEVQSKISFDDYIFIPTNQLKGNIIVIALEPKSMLGLTTYKNFNYLLKPKEYFPILRVVKN